MHKNWMTSCLVLAILIILLASLSSATCPWFIRNDLYSAQCGVIKEVPASAGLLANDPGAVAVLNPGGITIDPKYGTIKVEADGSFVYNPSPNIMTGTYVQFSYNATNGVCAANHAGIAKIQISCKCRPNAMDVTICMPKNMDEVKARLTADGVGCWGCGDITPTLDVSQVKLKPGTYPYLLKCPYCTAAAGLVTITGACQAYAPDFTFCESEVTLDELLGMIDEGADCIGDGCDQSLDINVDDVIVVNGFVAGGTYMATCGEGTECESSATGTITVTQRCEVEALSLSTPCTTLDELTELLQDTQPCGDCPDATLVIDTSDVVVGDDGFVSGGTYTATCIVGQDCESSAAGEIMSTGGSCIFCPCEPVAAPVEVCQGAVKKDALEAMILDGNVSCEDVPGLACDAVPVVDLSSVDVDKNGFVTGGTYVVTCGSDEFCPVAAGTVTVIGCTCEARAPDICACTDASMKDIVAEIESVAECEGCDADLDLDLSKITPGAAGTYEYTLKCGQAACPASEDTGYVHIMEKAPGYKSDLGTYPVYMDQTTLVGVAHVEVVDGNLVITVDVPGMNASYFKVQTTPITDCSTGSDWDQLGGGDSIVFTKPLSEISGLTCSSTLYIGVHVNAPNTAWAKGGCDISCSSGSRWAYGIRIRSLCEEKCPCDP